jgi:hypothetical protein
MKISFSLSIFCLLFLLPFFVHAQTERHYNYDSIAQTFRINQDSTVSVREMQTFNFTGEYHVGRRSVALHGVGAIDGVSVGDGETGQAFVYSRSRLDKFDPASWGKYTYFTDNGYLNIEWYGNLKDSSHRFVLYYRLHDVIRSFKDYDQLYFNLATEYKVPIAHIEATVVLPKEADPKSLRAILTSTNNDPTLSRVSEVRDGNTLFFSRDNVAPMEAVTISARWSKGVPGYSVRPRDMFISKWILTPRGWIQSLFR